jgi:hypothetical protein
MTKKILLLALIFLIVGCAKTVSFNLSDDFHRFKPASVIVMPVTIVVTDEDETTPDVLNLLRSTALDKLLEKDYSSMSLKETDALLNANRLLEKEKLPAPRTLAPIFRTDAVLYTRITEWNKGQLGSYASLKIGIQFMLYSSKGTLLWEGSYSTKQSDFRFDGDATTLGVLKAYEPRIQRITDAVFLTLPIAQRKEERQQFYRWLP